MSQFVLILDRDWLVVAFQKLSLRIWDIYLFVSQFFCPLLSECMMMRDGFVAQLEACRVLLKRACVLADEFAVRVIIRPGLAFIFESQFQGNPESIN